MTKQDLKKILAAALAGGAIASGSFVASDKINCDYEFEFQGEMICVSEEIKEVIETHLQPNPGFGGTPFGG